VPSWSSSRKNQYESARCRGISGIGGLLRAIFRLGEARRNEIRRPVVGYAPGEKQG